MFPWNMKYQTTPHYIQLMNSISNVWTLFTLKSFTGLSMPATNSGHTRNMSLLMNTTMYRLHLMLWFLYELWIPPLTLCLQTNACTIRPLYSMLWHPQVWKEHLLFLARGITQYHSKGVCSLVLHRFLRQVPFIFFGNAATQGPMTIWRLTATLVAVPHR
jgi:hypothetical protein